MFRRILILVALAMGLGGAVGAAQSPGLSAPPETGAPSAPERPHRGDFADEATLRKALTGNTVLGQDEGRFSTEYYGHDGRYAERTQDGTGEGSWMIRNGRVCIARQARSECWHAIIVGSMVTWIDERGDSDGIGTIVEGNPSRL
jgi:hypothetical protein